MSIAVATPDFLFYNSSQKIQKITCRLALAIATVATIAVSMTAPSQATTPSRIISARDGRPAIAIFAGSSEAYAIGCPDLDKLWGGMDYQPTFRTIT